MRYLCIFFLLVHAKMQSQTIYAVGYNRIYALDVNTCNITDSTDISSSNFLNIAQNKDGLIYGTGRIASGINNYDSIFVFNPITKQINYVCNLPYLNAAYNSISATFDNDDNFIFTGWDTITRTTHFYGFNINTCTFSFNFDLQNTVIIDGDIVFANDYLYYTGNCFIWKIDLSNTILQPTKVFNSSYSCSIPNNEGYYAIWDFCYNDTISFVVSNIEDNITKLYKYNPYTGNRSFLCTINNYIYDGAFYNPQSQSNYFNLGKDTTINCSNFNFTLKTNINTTQWSTGQVGKSIIVTQPGMYWAKITNGCGIFTDTIIIKSNSTSIKLTILNADTTICEGTRLTIKSNQPNTIWKDGIIGNQISATIYNDTIIIAKLPYVSCFGNDTLLDTLKIKVDKNIPLKITSLSNNICSQPLVLQTNYQNAVWNTGDIGKELIVEYAGKYYATFKNSCKIFADTITITSALKPKLNIGNDTFICLNSTITLKSNIPSTIWSNGSIAQQISVANSGIYWAKYIDSCNNYTDTIIIIDYQPQNLSIGNDTTICIGENIKINSTASNTIWGNGNIGNNINLTIFRDTIINVKNENRCINTGYNFDVKNIHVIDDVLTINSVSNSLCGFDSILLESNHINTLWRLSNGIELINNKVYVNDIGTYYATYTGTCKTIGDSIVITKECNKDCNMFLPTAFSPNNDGINDKLLPLHTCNIITDYSFEIFNRWGELIFNTNNILEYWDGKYKGVFVEQDNFIGIINYKTQNISKKIKQIITLLK
jgi:gliding motility-associated-like protein